jgi:endoglucanase
MSCRVAPEPILGLDWSSELELSEAPAARLPKLHTQGSAIVDEQGALVRLRGVNVCSLEFDREGKNFEIGDDGRSEVLRVLAERWGANAVRIPANQQWFLEDDAYVRRIEALIDDAAAQGLYALLDVQWEKGERTDPYHANILEIPTFGAGNTTEAFWLKATARWSNRTNLIYDLINEAHGYPDADTALAMQTLVNAIRTRDQETIIVVSGMNWAHSVDYYRTRPLSGGNLVYSAHQYLPYDPPSAFAGNWARTAKTIPVLLGEFLGDNTDASYAITLVDEAERVGAVGWMPWAIGCGFSKDDDLVREPLMTLAARMKQR